MPRFGNGANLARELGISRQAVSKAEKSGRISRTADGRFDLDAAAIQYGLHTDHEQQRRALAQHGQGATRATSEPLVGSDWRIRRERAETEQAEIELAQLKGTLGTISGISSQARRAAYAINSGLEQFPDRIAAEFGINEEHRRKLRLALIREIDQLRGEVAAALLNDTQ